MASLSLRRDLFDELTDFRRNFEQMFDRLTGISTMSGRPNHGDALFIPPIDAWVDRDSKKYKMRVALPGVEPNEVHLNVEGHRLIISGEHETSEERDDADFHFREFSIGRFERVVLLPEGVDTERLTAEYKDGVVEISAPVTGAALPRKIEIKSLPKAKAATA